MWPTPSSTTGPGISSTFAPRFGSMVLRSLFAGGGATRLPIARHRLVQLVQQKEPISGGQDVGTEADLRIDRELSPTLGGEGPAAARITGCRASIRPDSR